MNTETHLAQITWCTKQILNTIFTYNKGFDKISK